MISSSTLIVRGTDSPVSEDVSSVDSPKITIPSTGTFSPGLTTIISPISTSSGSIVTISPSRSTFANSGAISIRSLIDFLDFSTAIFWKNSPT